jgi:uncharacterized protein with HEPN domain
MFAAGSSAFRTLKSRWVIYSWIQTLENRNRTAHTYDEITAEKVIKEIVAVHYPLLLELYDQLRTKK